MLLKSPWKNISKEDRQDFVDAQILVLQPIMQWLLLVLTFWFMAEIASEELINKIPVYILYTRIITTLVLLVLVLLLNKVKNLNFKAFAASMYIIVIGVAEFSIIILKPSEAVSLFPIFAMTLIQLSALWTRPMYVICLYLTNTLLFFGALIIAHIPNFIILDLTINLIFLSVFSITLYRTKIAIAMHLFLKAKEEKKTAELDVLTGAYNRLGFNRRTNTSNINDGAILFIDIDNFKIINDKFGHAKGDAVIRKVADIIKNNIRNNDVSARFGGEEFIVLLSEQDITEAVIIAERIRKNIEKYTNPSTTISCGVAVLNKELNKELEIKRAIKNADYAMLKAKRTGKNKIVVYAN